MQTDPLPFMALLARDFPGMVARYEQLYARRYVDQDYEKRVQEVVSLMRARYGIAPRRGIQEPASPKLEERRRA